MTTHNTEENVCYFCHKETDIEEAMPLIDVNEFLECDCHITSHLDCWATYIRQIQDVYIGCPKCQIPIVGWRTHISTHELNEIANHKKYGMYYGLGFLCVILSTLAVGFGIGFSIQH
jgi:hypothetical protein